jgi:hypothetical protein
VATYGAPPPVVKAIRMRKSQPSDDREMNVSALIVAVMTRLFA